MSFQEKPFRVVAHEQTTYIRGPSRIPSDKPPLLHKCVPETWESLKLSMWGEKATVFPAVVNFCVLWYSVPASLFACAFLCVDVLLHRIMHPDAVSIELDGSEPARRLLVQHLTFLTPLRAASNSHRRIWFKYIFPFSTSHCNCCSFLDIYWFYIQNARIVKANKVHWRNA